MMKAIWNGTTIAESDHTVVVEGNHYFPADSVHHDLLKESSHSSICPWKGKAHYYSIVVKGDTNKNAAWYYPDPFEAANEIKGYLAFWNGVEITD